MSNSIIIGHVEDYLGEMDQAWGTPFETETPLNVACFSEQPANNVNTYVTFGLSLHILAMPDQKKIKQELVFTVTKLISEEEVVNFVCRIADLIISRHEALLRGQVIGPGKPLFSNSKMNAIYITSPTYFDDGFGIFEDSCPSTILAWMVPIFSCESDYINEHGWSAFEDILEKANPKLWDLCRSPVINSKDNSPIS